MFDLSLPKLLVLTVIALVIFGPDELPAIAAQVGRALRDLRTIAESAENDLREGLGPEFADLEIEDLNPNRFARKHLSGDRNAAHRAEQQPARQAGANGTPLTPGNAHKPDGQSLRRRPFGNKEPNPHLRWPFQDGNYESRDNRLVGNDRHRAGGEPAR